MLELLIHFKSFQLQFLETVMTYRNQQDTINLNDGHEASIPNLFAGHAHLNAAHSSLYNMFWGNSQKSPETHCAHYHHQSSQRSVPAGADKMIETQTKNRPPSATDDATK